MLCLLWGFEPTCFTMSFKNCAREISLSAILILKSLPYFQVICVHDVSNIYKVPLLLHDQNASEMIIKRLKLSPHVDAPGILKPTINLPHWAQLSVLWVFSLPAIILCVLSVSSLSHIICFQSIIASSHCCWSVCLVGEKVAPIIYFDYNVRAADSIVAISFDIRHNFFIFFIERSRGFMHARTSWLTFRRNRFL